MAQASDVPGRFDLVVNGTGFILDRAEAPQAVHELTPTFVDRQNVTGSYGDNQQDFWMTLSQNDWSDGEQQKFIRVNDAESRRRYWRGNAIDISTEGQVQLGLSTISLSVAAAVIASASWRGIPVFTAGTSLYRVDTTTVSNAGTFTTSLTGHGAYGLTGGDDMNVFIACATGGTNGCIRKWNGTAFSDFAPSYGVTAVEFHNNQLYGVGATSGGAPKLYSFDTSGAGDDLYTWNTADGTANTDWVFGRLRSVAGDLWIVAFEQAGKIFSYDGTGVAEVAQMPPAFVPTEVCVSEGIVFVGGSYYKLKTSNSEVYHLPAVFYYVDGTLNELWRADSYTSTTTAVRSQLMSANPVPVLNGVAWWDSVRQQLLYYDIRSGAISGVSANTAVSGLGAFTGFFAFFNGPDASHAGLYPDPSNTASIGYVQTSLFDADSSLLKYWKSVRVDADVPTGGSFDIAYRVNDLDSSYTNVQTTAVSGTEYTIGASGRSITVKVTLNNGTSASPVLKRIYVRGMPLLDTFKRKSYVVDCSGVDARDPVVRRDGTPETSTGLQLAQALVTAAAATSPFTVSDEFGSITALIEPQTLRVERMRDREYRASFTLRQV